MADLVTNGGKGQVTLAMVNATNPAKFAMWGTGTGQTAASTALATAAAPTTVTAVTGTATQQTTTTTNDTFQVVSTITAGGTVSISEYALTTNATIASGTMFNYHSWTALPLVNLDSLTITDQTVVA